MTVNKTFLLRLSPELGSQVDTYRPHPVFGQGAARINSSGPRRRGNRASGNAADVMTASEEPGAMLTAAGPSQSRSNPRQ